MAIRLYKSYTPGTRNRALSDFSEITKTKPEKTLIRKNHRNKGRNNRGVITIRHRGGGHKRLYLLIDLDECPPEGINVKEYVTIVNKCILTLIETSEVRHML